MFKIFIVSLFTAGLLLSGCATAQTSHQHQGCHKVGVHPAGRNNGFTHHHHAKPQTPVEEKK